MSVALAGSYRKTLRCKKCGKLWIVKLSRFWKIVTIFWMALVFPLSSYAALILWNLWPAALVWGFLFSFLGVLKDQVQHLLL